MRGIITLFAKMALNSFSVEAVAPGQFPTSLSRNLLRRSEAFFCNTFDLRQVRAFLKMISDDRTGLVPLPSRVTTFALPNFVRENEELAVGNPSPKFTYKP